MFVNDVDLLEIKFLQCCSKIISLTFQENPGLAAAGVHCPEDAAEVARNHHPHAAHPLPQDVPHLRHQPPHHLQPPQWSRLSSRFHLHVLHASHLHW